MALWRVTYIDRDRPAEFTVEVDRFWEIDARLDARNIEHWQLLKLEKVPEKV